MPYAILIENQESFYVNIKKKSINDCWEWDGTLYSNGYGCFRFCINSFRYHIKAHRASFIINNKKEIPKNYNVCHKCDNPKCVNPSHLFLGTPKDNSRDMVNKNRSFKPRGIKHPKAKLKNNDIIKIRKLHKNGVSTKEISKIFNIGIRHINNIINNKYWTHIKEIING